MPIVNVIDISTIYAIQNFNNNLEKLNIAAISEESTEWLNIWNAYLSID